MNLEPVSARKKCLDVEFSKITYKIHCLALCETKVPADAVVLLQRLGDTWKPVSYVSRATSGAQWCYAHEKEALAAKVGLWHWNCIVKTLHSHGHG